MVIELLMIALIMVVGLPYFCFYIDHKETMKKMEMQKTDEKEEVE